jgi:hypothetical protein
MSFISCRQYTRRTMIFPWASAFYTLKRFDLFSPMCIILIDGKAKSKEADHGRDACAGQAIRQGRGGADGAGR